MNQYHGRGTGAVGDVVQPSTIEFGEVVRLREKPPGTDNEKVRQEDFEKLLMSRANAYSLHIRTVSNLSDEAQASIPSSPNFKSLIQARYSLACFGK